MAEIELRGIDKVRRLLDVRHVETASRRAIGKFAREVKLRAVPYPPEGPWNQPGPYPHRWYQRHFGPRWGRKDGSIGGRNTSEVMQKKWYDKTVSPWQAVVGNKASYADWVVGEQQAAVHRQHGWKKLADVARETMPLWERLLAVEVERAMEGR